MRVWVGYHPNVGILIFDPTLQKELENGLVRLWDVNKSELKIFDKEAVRQKLCSLRSHLAANRLDPLIDNHGIVGQVAKRYLQSRPSLATDYDDQVFDDDEPTWNYADMDQEGALILQEVADDQDAWARSEEEGWFYE